ncbi:YDG domain-containing protein [Shinella sp. NM-101]|uniref:YDG domain-containing protein n=1 Tax=Shinella sp. NM-101 TaxID=2744455 RepID=UPI001F2A77F1|nr:YDG domain-containing protein [Shinella sp. NM-101]
MFRSQDRGFAAHQARMVALLASTALITANSGFAQSLPTGGQVAAGSATIGTNSNGALTINQSSGSAVINWQSFNIGQGNSVTFVQPNVSSAILNRVTGGTTTSIAGQLNANGQVYIVNPNGIAITSTGTVDAGAFVASTLGISDRDFMTGQRAFTGNGASASATNAGTITINRGGYMALIGGSVANSGTINVPLGKVGLGSGERATLDVSGDGFLQVAIPTEAQGTDALVSNSGRISADGGTVQLTAAAARTMARQAVNMSGTIEANTVGGRSGDIILGGSDGKVAVSGKIRASGKSNAGGKVAITGRDLKLKGAQIDVSGRTGGGTVKVGGDRQGKGTLQRAEVLDVDSRTLINADATWIGNGGNVALWSDNATSFAGTISAKGGAVSGNGGDAEVSGEALLSYTGFTDLRAANGFFGTLLLDPYNVTISSGASSNVSGFTATGNDSVIDAATLLTALSGANVVVSTGSSGSQAGNITVAAPLSWSAGTTLTLNAANSIYVNAPITFGGAAGAGLNLYAAAALAINAPIAVKGAGAVALTHDTSLPTNLSFGLAGSGFSGSFTYLNASGNVQSASPGNQSLAINGDAYTLIYSMADLDAIDGTSAATGNAVTTYGAGLAGKYALASNLNAAGTTYTAGLIASGGTTDALPTAFSGAFEGLGHTISNLTISGTTNYHVGLFGYSTGAVRDVGLTGGSVSGYYNVGGLVGYNSGSIAQSYSGIASATARQGVGGLVGINVGQGAITQSFATGAASAKYWFGGLAGRNEGVISQSYATGALTGWGTELGDSYYGGGLVGYNTGTIRQSYATGSVTSGPYGYHYGGLVGQNGGYSGQNVDGVIDQSYATGAVWGGNGNYIGGLVGTIWSGSVTNSYWNTQTSGRSNGVGWYAEYYTGPVIDTGRTTAHMQDLSNFATNYAGWDFNNVWAPPNQVGQNNNSATAYYPQLYVLSHVVAVAPGAITTVYGNGAQTLPAQYYGLRAGDTITSQATTAGLTTTTPVGTHTISGTGAGASNAAYRFVYMPAQVTVTPRPLSLSGTRTYDGTTNLASTIFSLSNLANGESLTLSGLGAMGDKNVGSGKSISLGTLLLGNGNGGLASNYTLSGGAHSVDIAKATLTLTGITASNKTYDGTTAAAMANAGTLAGIALNDEVSFSSLGANFADKDVGIGKTVTISGITLSGADAGNYMIASTATGAADISQRVLNLSGNRVYDGSADLAASIFTLGNLVNGEQLTLSGGGWMNDKNAGSEKAFSYGSLAIDDGAGGVASNYTLLNGVGRVDVAKAQIAAVSGITASGKTYDGTASATLDTSGATFGGMIANDDLTVGSASGTFIDKNAATGKAVTISGITLSGADAGNYALVSDTAMTTATIARAQIAAVGGITASGKTYDGTASATLDTSGATFGGMIANDDLTVGSASGAFADKNAGMGKAVTISGITLSGADAGNYTLVSDTAMTTATIARAQIAAVGGITASGKTYDGTASATLDTSGATFGGMIANDDLTVGSASGAFADKNAGMGKAVTISGITLSGADAGNYTLVSDTATTTATIARAQIAAVGGIAASGKTYDGTASATLDTSGATFGGMIANDDLTVGSASGAFADKNAAIGKAVTISGITLSGADAGNYTLVSDTATTTATIARAQIAAVGGIAASGKTYDGTASATLDTSGATFGGMIANDDLTVGSASGAFADKNAGMGKAVTISGITLSGADAGNYTLVSGTATTTADIGQRVLNLAGGRVYDGSIDLAASIFTLENLVSGEQLTLSGAGWMTDKHAAQGKSVSFGSLTLGDGQGGLASNYTLAGGVGRVDIGKAVISSIGGIIAGNRVYDGTANVTLDTSDAFFSGMIANDVLAVGSASGAFIDKNAGTGKTVNIGGLTLTGADAGNYVLASATATATADIGRRALTVEATALDRVYGDTNPALTYTSSDLLGNDTLTGALSTTADKFSGVGVYAITQGSLGNTNYDISYTGADLTVSTRHIDVTANSFSRFYGLANPSLGWTVGAAGLVNGDVLLGNLATTATTLSAPGDYAITQGSLHPSANYTMNFISGVLTVEQAVRTEPGSLSGSLIQPLDVARFLPIHTAASNLAQGADGGVLIADPRFDGTVICLAESAGGCAVLASQSAQ